MRRNIRKSAGFTLIELLLVIVIIATLAAIVVPSFAGKGEDARKAAAKGQISAFETCLDMYEADNGAYPTTTQGLEALRNEPSPKPRNWRGPYMKKELPVDPWGKAYQYKSPGTHHPTGCDIWTCGPDGMDGTDDDIGNWNLQDQPKK
jgi:general secretion pathway protein G